MITTRTMTLSVQTLESKWPVQKIITEYSKGVTKFKAASTIFHIICPTNCTTALRAQTVHEPVTSHSYDGGQPLSYLVGNGDTLSLYFF